MSDLKLIKKDITFRNIGKIFSGSEDAPLRIPDYQRSYAWTADEINDFIRDLNELKDLRLSNEPRTHFLGGIVVFEQESEENFPKKLHLVIDGQQRLITLQITLGLIKQEYQSLLENFAKEEDKSNRELYSNRTQSKINEIDNFFQFQFTSTLGDETSVPILKASDRDQNVFMKVLNNEDTPQDVERDSHKRIRSGRNRIRKYLVQSLRKQDEGDEEYFRKLGTLLDCVKEDCHIIYIVCPSMDDAYELFQVLNDRGKSLTDGDLLRAYTFQKIHEMSKNHDFYNSLRPYWDEILSNPDGNIKRFLEQYLRVHTGERAQTKQLYRQFRNSIFEADLSEISNDNNIDRIRAIRDRVIDLRDQFRVFSSLLEAEWPFETTHDSIDDYDKSRLKFLVQILGLKNLSIFLAAQQKLSQKEFRDLIYIVERFFFRYRTICGGSAVSIGDTFGKHANLILLGQYDIDKFKQDLQELIDEDASDEIFRANLRSNLVFHEGNKHIIKYFLLFIEDYRKLITEGVKEHLKAVEDQKTSIPVIKKSSTIEHIYPQTPRKGEEQSDISNHEVRGSLTNSLGNLTILGRRENSSLGNRPYSEKHEILKNSNLWINRECANNYEQWNADNLLKRENWFLDNGLKVFRL